MVQINKSQISFGKNIPAIDRIKLFSPDEWEEFIDEWITTKKSYIEHERLGGAGDKGRDVVGYITQPVNNKYRWDNYQCKHYDHPLIPSDIWVEFGKLCYYTFKKEFPVPDNYYFISPLGVGTTLSNYLNSASKLKDGVIKNWDKYCLNKITKTEKVQLEGKLLTYVENFDFSIFKKITPLTLVEEHSKTQFHLARFGGGMPSRPDLPPIPTKQKDNEINYIKNLLKAYNSDSSKNVKEISKLDLKYLKHFERSRESFYSAEQLKLFSRDILPPKIFDELKEEIYSGTVTIFEDDYDSGYKRVIAVEQESCKLCITSNPLIDCCTQKDRKGICHHLSNEGKYMWVPDYEQ